MSQIEPIISLPNWDWTENTLDELITTGEALLDQSDFVWRIGHAAIAGFVYNSLVNPPWMWFMLTKGTTLSDLIDFRRLTRLIPIGTLTAVNENFLVGMKFAKFYGFVPTGENVEFHGRIFKLMRKN